MRGRSWENPGELRAFVARRMAAYNHTPQVELGGLSPDQAHQLLDGDWETTGALRVGTLSADDAGATPHLVEARALLGALCDAPLGATATGNLNRAALRTLRERGAGKDPEFDHLYTPGPNANELDFFLLHIVRVTCELARLLRRSRGTFRALKLGRELAAPARAGDLHRVLFFTFHRVFNLAYLDRMEENPALQHTIAFSWYQLGRLAADWGSCEAIAKDAVLPAAHPAPPPPSSYRLDDLPFQFRARVVRPLIQFGLLERRPLPGDVGRSRDFEIRKTASFDLFLQFDLH